MRKIHRSAQRSKELNFSLEGMVGTTLSHKTIGVIGAGQIGLQLIRLLKGFNCRVLVHDINKSSIELPSHADVLLGRGRPKQEHSGNMHLRQLINSYCTTYESAERGNNSNT